MELDAGLQEAKLGLALVEQESGNEAAANKGIQEAAIHLYPEESAVHRRLAYVLYR